MADVREPPRPATDTLLVGTFLAHGPAPYQFQQNAEPSYYIRIDTQRGPQTVWGRGLEKALARSQTKPRIGEPIGVRENGTDPVTVRYPQRDDKGTTITQRTAHTPRPHWVVERREFFDERLAAARMLRDKRVHPRDAVKAFPDLVGAYFVLAAAGDLIRERTQVPAHHQRFLALVRESLARTVEIGEPLPAVRLRDRELLARRDPDPPTR